MSIRVTKRIEQRQKELAAKQAPKPAEPIVEAPAETKPAGKRIKK